MPTNTVPPQIFVYKHWMGV